MSEASAAENDRPGRVDIWRPRRSQEVELHHGSNVDVEYPRHWHDELYLCVTLAGASHLEFCGRSVTVSGLTLAVIPSGEIHANRKIGCSFRVAFLDPVQVLKGVENYIEQDLPAVNFRSQLIDDGGVASAFLRSHALLENPSSELANDSILFEFLQAFVRSHGSERDIPLHHGNEDCAIRKARNFLEERYSEPVSLSELARLTGLSPWHLNRSFARTVGMPPHAYQLQVRLARAKALLRQEHSMAEVASLTGFYDQSHFTHHFKRHEGMTPLQYRRYRKDLQDNRTHTAYFGSR